MMANAGTKSEHNAEQAAANGRRSPYVLPPALILVAFVLLAACTGDVRQVQLDATPYEQGEPSFAGLTPRAIVSGDDAWKPYVIQFRKPLEILTPDAGTVALSGHDAASGAWTQISLDPNAEPLLTWEWSLRRTGTVPQPLALLVGFDADEGDVLPDVRAWADKVEETHKVRPPLRSIGYVFGGNESRDLAVSAFFAPSAVFLINLREPVDADGRFKPEVRDIAADYRAVFGVEPPRVKALAFMGDARGKDSRIEAKLRSVGVFPASARALPDAPRMTAVEPRLHCGLLWFGGISLLVCMVTGAWLMVRVRGKMRESWASRRAGAVSGSSAGANAASGLGGETTIIGVAPRE